MAKISAYPDGVALRPADKLVIARAGANFYILGSAMGMPAGYLYGLTLSNNGIDAVNDIDIDTGQCRDSTNVADIVLAAAITKRLDAAWAVGTNQGGLDTGAIANTTYHVWVIKRSDTGVVDVLFSTSATAPTMPASYDYKRRIGSIIRSGGSIVGFVQDGDKFVLKVPVNDVGATNPGTAAVTRTLSVPTGVRVEAIISVSGYGTTTASMPGGILITDLSTTDTAPSSSLFSIYVYTVNTEAQLGTYMQVMTNTSAQVRSRIQVSAATTIMNITTFGWFDSRGR